MIPTVAATGTSFRGAAAYYLHDKEADTTERIAWTHTENLPTNDPDRAWKVMAWTAMHQATLKASAGVKATGQKLKAPVYAFSISWHPEQKPEKAHMLSMARQALALIGMSEHQAIFVCHSDEPHPHIHALVNRVHPVTGKAAAISRDWKKFQAMALAYEREHGKIYCPAREQNARQREARRPERVRNAVIEAAWRQSDNGRSFQAALAAKGYTLAQGNRRLVVVDKWGKAINPVREIAGVRAAAFKARLHDLDLSALPTAAAVQKRLKQEQRREYAVNRKFEKWSAEYLNKNQDRQIEERAAMNARYARTLDDRNEELAKHYRLSQLRESLAQLRERTDRPSLFRRLTGAAAKDRDELVAQQRQMQDAERRMAENLGAITTERDCALADLADRHARENDLAAKYIADKRPAFYAEERDAGQEQDRRGGAGRDRDDEGGRERVQYHHRPTAPIPL